MSDAVTGARSRAAAFLAARAASTEARALQASGDRAASRTLAHELVEAVDGSRPESLARALGWLGDLGLLSDAIAGRLAQHAAALQATDGSFPGGEGAGDVAMTGWLTGHLARSPRARLEMLEAAGDWLAQNFTPDLLQGFQWGNIAGYAQTFANLPHDAGDEILQWCGRELERGVRASQFSAVRTARVLLWCDAPVLPGAKIEPRELVAAMLGEQAEDGGFGEEDRLHETWDAWLALSRLA